MATLQDIGNVTDLHRGRKIDLIVAQWYSGITEQLYGEAFATLTKHGFNSNDITKIDVPGSYELTLAAQWSAKKTSVAAVICLGCLIQGATRHFEFIAQAVSHGLTHVALKYNKPVIFGVLTTENIQQAQARVSGEVGNKGKEAALAAIKMLALQV